MNKYACRIARQEIKIRKLERRIEELLKAQEDHLGRTEELRTLAWGSKKAINEAERKFKETSERLARGKW